MDTATIRRVAPVASAIYLAVFIIICGIFFGAFAADFQMDHNSELKPNATKTAAYQSHGQLLYVEPKVMQLAHRTNVAVGVSIGCGTCVALILTFYAKRKVFRQPNNPSQ
jgi:hypothetical protein